MIYDKRKLKRYDIFLIVEFKPLRSQGGYSIGITRDLSTNGFSLEAQTIECQRGDIIEFRLKHPDADWTVDISGEVIWRTHSWYKYIIGINFLNVTKEQNSKILKLMSTVIDAENKPEQIGKDPESLLETETEKKPDDKLGAGVIDNSIPDTHTTRINHVSLKEAEHCELTGTERTFIAGDVFSTSSAYNEKEIKPARDNITPEIRFKETLIKDKELNPETAQMPVGSNTADGTARTEKRVETDAVHEKIDAAHLNTAYRKDTSRVPYLNNIDPLENNRKKKLLLYVPFVMIVIIIIVIAYPAMIKIFYHDSNALIPVPTESTDNNSMEKDKNISASYNVQISSKDLNEPPGPSPILQTETKDAFPSEKDRAVNVRQTSAREDSSGILPPKSIVRSEVKSKNTEDAAPPAEIVKSIKNTSQLINATTSKPETSTAAKPLRDNIEKDRKIDLIAKINETLTNLRAIQNEKPGETEVVIETEKTTADKPRVKTAEQELTQQVVKLEETPATASVTESERIPVVEQEVKAREEKKEGIKKTEPAVKIREMPTVALLVKRDTPKNTQNNLSDSTVVTTADLLKKWKHIGNTKSGVPLFIAPDNISYPYQHVVNLMVKASVNKKVFINVLAINCSQTKLRVLEERSGNNPVFSSYSNEWKDINPESMILYNFACPEKK